MKTYKDYGVDETHPEVDKVKWTKFKIVVSTKEDKKELQEAFKYLHDMCDNEEDFVVINQLIHEYDYEDSKRPDNIVVNKKLYEILDDGEDPCLNFD